MAAVSTDIDTTSLLRLASVSPAATSTTGAGAGAAAAASEVYLERARHGAQVAPNRGRRGTDGAACAPAGVALRASAGHSSRRRLRLRLAKRRPHGLFGRGLDLRLPPPLAFLVGDEGALRVRTV